MSTSYITLKPGDVRQKGDEWRHKTGTRVPQKSYETSWQPLAPGMFGHVILPADVIVAEFRRAGK